MKDAVLHAVETVVQPVLLGVLLDAKLLHQVLVLDALVRAVETVVVAALVDAIQDALDLAILGVLVVPVRAVVVVVHSVVHATDVLDAESRALTTAVHLVLVLV